MKKFIKALAIVLCLSMVTPVVAPSIGVETVEAATKVKLNCSKKTIKEGDSFNLKITGTKKKVKWSSSNKKIATVSSKGVVNGIARGVCKITASVGGKKYTCKVTVNKVENKSKVTYISDRSVEYVSAYNVERFFFSLKDQDMNRISSSGTVDLRIENDGVVVYQKTVNFTPSNFEYWTSKLYGKQYLCSIDIPMSDIQAGKKDNGVLYYKVNEKNVSFDEYSLNIFDLPKEQRKIDVDTSSYISDKYAPGNKAQIISYNINNSNKIFLTFKITNISDSIWTSYSTTIYEYDKNGNILDDHFIFDNAISVGKTFVEEFYLEDDTVRIGITASSNGSTGNNNSSTIQKPTGTISENIAQLKQYIKNNGDLNVNGERFIGYTTGNYKSTIVYESQTDSLDFILSSTESGLSMKMTSANNSSTMQVDYVLYSSGIGIMATGYVNPSTYTSNTDVWFTLANSNSSILTDKDIQDLCNKGLQLGFACWKLQLYEKLAMELKDIGFTSYN